MRRTIPSGTDRVTGHTLYYQITVEDDDGEGLIELREDQTTSHSPSAQSLGVLDRLAFTEDEARAVHAALGDLLAARKP